MTEAALKFDALHSGHPFYDGEKWLWEKHYPEGTSWHAPILRRPAYQLLDEAAQKFAERPMCSFMGFTLKYKDIEDMSNRIAAGLQKHGVVKGTKVGLFLPNTPYSIAFFHGILKAGGTVVNYNPLYVERELIAQVEDSDTDILVTIDLDMLYQKARHVLEKTRLQKIILCTMADILPFPKNFLYPLVKRKDIAKNIPKDGAHVWWYELIANNGRYSPVTIHADEDVAVLQYTGGTTGVPKGAMLTHGNLTANTEQVAYWMSAAIVPGQEVMMGILPYFHVFAMTVTMNCALKCGMHVVLHPKFDLKLMMESINTYKPTFFPAVPAVFNQIASSPEVGSCDFSSLKFCASGGAPLPADVKRLFEEKTKCKAFGEGYGLTETSPVATFSSPVGKIKAGSVGQPMPSTVVEIVSPETGELLGVGERGEVCIRGPQVMKGYYKRPDATADMIRNGRLHTGDVGYLDEEGYLFLVDRIKDMILVRGYKVFPRIVEEALYLHPDVLECIVAGVPDAERGETVRAWVVPAAGKTLAESELQKFLEDKISPIEMPRKIVVREKSLPKTAVGKLSRKDLLAEEGIARS